MREVATARMEVQTPKVSLQAAFNEYELKIGELLHEEMERHVKNGSFAKAAVDELARQLPDLIKRRVESALYQIDLAPLINPILRATVEALAKSLEK